MKRYAGRIMYVPMSRTRRRERDDIATETEEKAYSALEGTLLFLGNGVLPQASLVTSKMQQRSVFLKLSTWSKKIIWLVNCSN